MKHSLFMILVGNFRPFYGVIFQKFALVMGTYFQNFGLVKGPCSEFSKVHTGCPKKIVTHLCGNCEGAVESIISVFTQLHLLGFNLRV